MSTAWMIGCGLALTWTTAVEVSGQTTRGAAPSAGRDTTVVVPGDGTLRLERLRPFRAEYQQLGHLMSVALVRTDGPVPTWDFAMQMPSPGVSGAVVDHVTHRAEDMGFFRRQFGYGAFRDEVLDARVREGRLQLHRFVREGEPMPVLDTAVTRPLVDGTFMYWALGLLPLDQGDAYRFSTWTPTADGVDFRLSGALVAGGRRTVDVGGTAVDAHVVSAETPSGRLEMTVVDFPPYLVDQEVVAPDGTRTPIVRLVSVDVPARDDAPDAIARASTAFSRAYMRGDTATVRSLYTEDAVLLPPNRDIRGTDAIGRYFAPVPGRTVLDHRMVSEELDVHGDVAIDVGTWFQRARAADGSESEAEGRYLIEWARHPDGRWRIRRDMWHRPVPGG